MARQRGKQLRIIGGEWRSRRLSFADAEGLRPTPDRVRETLFNWLAPIIDGARCLDPFAGSGALGFEALSRGAAEVVMLDKQRSTIKQLQDNLRLLHCERAELIHTDALSYLQQTAASPFDIVFLDPPYRQNLLTPCMDLLERQGWLKAEAYIYLELESEAELPELPVNWQLRHSKKAGQVAYHLACRHGSQS